MVISLETLITQEHSLITVDMPLKPKAPKKSVKKQLSDTHRYCLYCNAHRDGRGFDRHQAACKIIWQLQCRKKNPARSLSLENCSKKQMRAEKVVDPLVPIEVNFFDNPTHCHQLTEILKDELQVDRDILIPQCLDGGDSEMTLGDSECNY